MSPLQAAMVSTAAAALIENARSLAGSAQLPVIYAGVMLTRAATLESTMLAHVQATARFGGAADSRAVEADARELMRRVSEVERAFFAERFGADFLGPAR